jgi:hypothetical protein
LRILSSSQSLIGRALRALSELSSLVGHALRIICRSLSALGDCPYGVEIFNGDGVRTAGCENYTANKCR